MKEIDYYDVVTRIDKKLECMKQNGREVLAKECGISMAAISQWKNRKSSPSCTYIVRIADFLGVSLEWLLFGKEEQQDELTKEERELVEAYRHLSTQGKVVVSFIAKGLRQD